MRYWEIDFARGVAVILMLVYHTFFDAYFFGKLNLDGYFWYVFPRLIGGMFIFISGYTLSISYRSFDRVLRKAVKLAAIAAAISFATFLLFPEQPVYFGIIHFFALATPLAVPFVKKPKFSATLGAALFAVGVLLNGVRLETYALLWLGCMPRDFATLDYYPLLPWLGVMLLGVAAGSRHRASGVSFGDPVSWLGRHSLEIYLVQHPLIVAALCLAYPDLPLQLHELVQL